MKHFTISTNNWPNNVRQVSEELFGHKLPPKVVSEVLEKLWKAMADPPVILFQFRNITGPDTEVPCCVSPENGSEVMRLKCLDYGMMSEDGFFLRGYIGRCPHCMRGRLIVREVTVKGN